MSTPFVFAEELPELLTVAAADIIMLWDTSESLYRRCTVSAADLIVDARGTAASTEVGFYGVTAINQGTQAGTAITALTTVATISAGKAAGVWGWAKSTMATNFVTVAAQCQTDLLTLMRRINSTGLVDIDGV